MKINYLIKKIKLLIQTESEDLLKNLIEAIGKQYPDYIYDKDVFYEYIKNFHDLSMCLTDYLPKSPNSYYSAETNSAKGGECGLYVHILNEDINLNNFSEYLKEFQEISGEICVSNFDDEQHITRRSTIGLILSGTPTKTFDCDCWSEIGKDGKRYATRLDSYSNRSESWIIPKNSKIVGLVYNDNMQDFAISESIKNELNITIKI